MIGIRFSILLFSISLSSLSAISQKNSSNSLHLSRPKLVVGLVVDQMRWDYLYRYYDRYNENGFKRLLNQGFSCENTQINYLPTFTACGHAGIYTGSVPSINGIAGNDWVIQSSGKKMYCTADSSVQSVGTTSVAGKMSPKNLLTTTITDELKLATNFRSKVIGIAFKDRGAIIPAGHSADAAYWYDDLTGNWISSTYYQTKLPTWVAQFNANGLVEKYISQKWETLFPLNTYNQSSSDSSTRYEEKFSHETAPVFPHSFPAQKNNFSTIKNTPFANNLTFDFAKAAIKEEQIGKDAITDFLALSLSTPDYLGHQFGPNSVEIEDMYLRLDKEIASFLVYLDNTIGNDQYTFFLSADHGAAHNPTFLTDHKIPAGQWNGTDNAVGSLTELNEILAKKYGTENLIRYLYNYQIHFDYTRISEKRLDIELIKKDVITYYKKQPSVGYAIDLKNIGNEPIPAALRERIINGYNEKRSGEIQLILNPGFYHGYGSTSTGTTHGTWNPYDTHIPLLFMGWGIKQGKTSRLVSMNDIASTLSQLLHIQEPNGNIGTPILEILK